MLLSCTEDVVASLGNRALEPIRLRTMRSLGGEIPKVVKTHRFLRSVASAYRAVRSCSRNASI